MYNNSIGVIYSLSELLNNGPDKLLDLSIDCVQLTSRDTELYTEKNAATSEEMNSQASTLQGYISQFKLRKDTAIHYIQE